MRYAIKTRLPLADLRLLLGMERWPPTIETRFIVVEIDLDGDPTAIGLVAEKVYEVTVIAMSAMLDKPSIGISATSARGRTTCSSFPTCVESSTERGG